MGKGIQFDQIAADWQPNRRVRWIYRFTNDSFPPGVLDDHVRIGGQYFDVIDNEYVLRKVNAGTELRVTMRYRVSTAFNWYTLPIAGEPSPDNSATAATDVMYVLHFIYLYPYVSELLSTSGLFRQYAL